MPEPTTIEDLFADANLRTVVGVEVFKAGTHRDSQGRERVWSSEELNQMLASFGKGIPSSVPIKLGHSSEKHNALVAKALDIPTIVLGGEGDNRTGSARLGRVAKLARSNGTLIANFEIPDRRRGICGSNSYSRWICYDYS